MGTEWQKLKDTTDHTDLLQRLKGLKGFLKGWNAKMFGNVYFHIQEVSKKIEELDGADPASVDLQQLLVQKRELQADLWKLSRYNESIWRQKSRVRWLKEGDRKSSFFHRVAKIRAM
ncbi:hypothetical protein V6N12_049089 [Hibiscus sabdariffa]|uniref:Uncharacterized protein n=1 Tax=Hibiscus sabdariffa TaxID=183260 RepID=A0ABR2EJ55_9ROSI